MRPLFFVLALVATQTDRLEVAPSSLEMRVGDERTLEATVRDASGEKVANAQVVFFSQSPQTASVTAEGVVTAHRSGEATLVALVPAELQSDSALYRDGDPGVRVEIRARVSPSPLARIEIRGVPDVARVGQKLKLSVIATDANGETKDVRAEIRSSDAGIADVSRFGAIFPGTFHAHPFYHRPRPELYPGDAAAIATALEAGEVTFRASFDGLETEKTLRVEPSPVDALVLLSSADEARTGDVIRFRVEATDGSGNPLSHPPVTYFLDSNPDPSRAETVGAGAPAEILDDGRFVAEQAGLYTVLALSGDRIARRTVRIRPRDVSRSIEFVGHASVGDRITSDLWVWEGVDGRDYAIVGTWNADGRALLFDVTDPSRMERIADVQVDARTVNDVKVSADGRIAVFTREGASNRRNGFVVVDVSDPRKPEVLSRFDDELTGGVHNVFLYQDHVFAINNGRRWDVVNIEDPKKPFRVARFEDERPGRSVHDVWVRDGIAFQAGNSDGIVLVDVGGGGLGGSPANPIEMGRLPQLTGWNHAVWPFRSRSAGRFYVIAGDEAHPVNPRIPGPIISWEERAPSRAMGYIHVLEFDDPSNPREVARYEVPEAGPHNVWIDWEQEVMYVAYFNAGLRVVDVSGELVGDLYRQGREMAKFYSDDRDGYVPNSPFAWGPQPHKGVVFFSDFHSGLWAVRLLPPESSSKESMP